jgi:hypothetical protein
MHSCITFILGVWDSVSEMQCIKILMLKRVTCMYPPLNVHTLLQVLEMVVSELQCAQQHFLQQSPESIFLAIVMRLVDLLCLILPSPSSSPSLPPSSSPSASSSSPDKADPKIVKFRQTMRRLVKLGLTTPSGRSLLHLAVDRRTASQEFCGDRFPHVNVVKVGARSRSLANFA